MKQIDSTSSDIGILPNHFINLSFRSWVLKNRVIRIWRCPYSFSNDRGIKIERAWRRRTIDQNGYGG
jgi:hypothetical protein